MRGGVRGERPGRIVLANLASNGDSQLEEMGHLSFSSRGLESGQDHTLTSSFFLLGGIFFVGTSCVAAALTNVTIEGVTATASSDLYGGVCTEASSTSTVA